jgi:hypothetical protein
MGSQDQWYNLTGSSGKVQLGIRYQPTYVRIMSLFRSIMCISFIFFQRRVNH